MKKIYFIIFLIFLSACSEDKRVENDNDLLQITFATDWKAQAEQGGFYQALASGKYLEKGLDVKIIQGSANINIPRLLASNSIDFGMGSNSFIPMNMVANNIPGKAVMAVFQKDPQIIMTHGDNNINSIDDIKGLPIMIADASIGGFWLWLKSKYNFNDSQIRKKTISLAPFLKDVSSIQQGYLTSEPYLFEQITGQQPKVFLMADYGYPSYGAMILASNKMITENPDIVQGFVDASIEGWIEYIYGDPSLGNQLILNENNEMTEAVLFQAIKKIREYNMISNEVLLGKNIGTMTLEINSKMPTISTMAEHWKKGRFSSEKWDQKILVEVITLDQLIKIYGKPDYIKIDVEGFELEVLLGLTQKVGIISFEFASEFLDQTFECLSHLKKIGYNDYNFSIGEKRKFFSEWSTTDKLIKKLENEIVNDKMLWGDIYCK